MIRLAAARHRLARRASAMADTNLPVTLAKFLVTVLQFGNSQKSTARSRQKDEPSSRSRHKKQEARSTVCFVVGREREGGRTTGNDRTLTPSRLC